MNAMTADGQHYSGCPCHACVTIRAARPQPPPPIAFLSCCGALVKLVRTLEGFTGDETHTARCQDTAGFLLPETKETT